MKNIPLVGNLFLYYKYNKIIKEHNIRRKLERIAEDF